MMWGGYCKEKLDGSHSYGSKGSNLMWTLFILSSMETSNNCVGVWILEYFLHVHVLTACLVVILTTNDLLANSLDPSIFPAIF